MNDPYRHSEELKSLDFTMTGEVGRVYEVYKSLWYWVFDNYAPRIDDWFRGEDADVRGFFPLEPLVATCTQITDIDQRLKYWMGLIAQGLYVEAEDYFWKVADGDSRVRGMVRKTKYKVNDVLSSNWRRLDDWGLETVES